MGHAGGSVVFAYATRHPGGVGKLKLLDPYGRRMLEPFMYFKIPPDAIGSHTNGA
jgi:pimeloyl-ACP methyl ester carboxylesterase